MLAGVCLAPVTAGRTVFSDTPNRPGSSAIPAGSPHNLALKSYHPFKKYAAYTNIPAEVCAAPPAIPITSADGRVYNKVVRNSDGAILQDLIRPTSAYVKTRDINFAYYRIHSTGILKNAPPSPACTRYCQYYDASQQIGCLVLASPCSIGLAGSPASEVLPYNKYATQDSMWCPDNSGPGQAHRIQVGALPPGCLAEQGSHQYPLTGYVWINSLIGFGPDGGDSSSLNMITKYVNNNEYNITQWFADHAAANCQKFGFTAIPPKSPSTHEYICRDFTEPLCNQEYNGPLARKTFTSNSDATEDTALCNQYDRQWCGDGVVQPFFGEQCDNGASNGDCDNAGVTCSIACTTCPYNY